jgi:epoxyqueuosine reductase QueG
MVIHPPEQTKGLYPLFVMGKEMNNESPEHESKLDEVCKNLRIQGYVVVKLNRKSPDAVASKDGKMVAVEVLAKYGPERNYKVKGQTFATKRRLYEGLGFDSVVFDSVRLDQKVAKENGPGWFGKASKILKPD